MLLPRIYNITRLTNDKGSQMKSSLTKRVIITAVRVVVVVLIVI